MKSFFKMLILTMVAVMFFVLPVTAVEVESISPLMQELFKNYGGYKICEEGDKIDIDFENQVNEKEMTLMIFYVGMFNNTAGMVQTPDPGCLGYVRAIEKDGDLITAIGSLDMIGGRYSRLLWISNNQLKENISELKKLEKVRFQAPNAQNPNFHIIKCVFTSDDGVVLTIALSTKSDFIIVNDKVLASDKTFYNFLIPFLPDDILRYDYSRVEPDWPIYIIE